MRTFDEVIRWILDQMDALVEHVGEKTGAEWRTRIAEMHCRLTVLLGDQE